LAAKPGYIPNRTLRGCTQAPIAAKMRVSTCRLFTIPTSMWRKPSINLTQLGRLSDKLRPLGNMNRT
jgi:hypothetical protein